MYTVVSLKDELIPAGSGMKLEEAWTLMMVLAGCDYAFERDTGGGMNLLVWNSDEARASGMPEPMDDGRDWRLYSSSLPDNSLARVAIMSRFLDDGMPGIVVQTDEQFGAEMARAVLIERDYLRRFPSG
ncbi:MAG TPA: hypothetical protein VGK90_11630 [Rhizomicrobium sp.]|jgi:hypothetical protein